MAVTTQVTISKTWTKISDGDCTVQSTSNNELMQIAINATTPVNAYIQLSLAEPTTFAYKTAVWARLTNSSTKTTETLNVIK